MISEIIKEDKVQNLQMDGMKNTMRFRSWVSQNIWLEIKHEIMSYRSISICKELKLIMECTESRNKLWKNITSCHIEIRHWENPFSWYNERQMGGKGGGHFFFPPPYLVLQ